MALNRTLFQRHDNIADADSIDKERMIITDTLRQNGYENLLTLRKQMFAKTKIRTDEPATDKDQPTDFVYLPYIAKITDHIAKLRRKDNIQVSFDTVHKIK